MHNPDYLPANNFVRVHFNQQFEPFSEQPKLKDLIKTKINNREYFYGIELSARSNSTLDYRNFGLMPLFTSLVWFGQYYNIDPLSKVDTVQFGATLRPSTVVMPHLTCYRLTPERLQSFLSLEFSNILALRGDDVDDEQDYRYASNLVAEIRKNRGDTITIGVGGYPQGHPQAKSKEDDLWHLKEKVNAGADFIITQLCFESGKIIEFIENCRTNGIIVPIIVGVYVPEDYSSMRRMMQITQVEMPPEQMEEYKRRKDNADEFKEYSAEMAGKLIREVFESNANVFGVQFFSMNRFTLIEKLVNNVLIKFNTRE